MKQFETRDDLIRSLRSDMVVCEIGVFKGEFSKYIYENIKPKELHMIDLFDGMMCSGDKDGNNIVWVNLDEEFIKLKSYFDHDQNVKIHKGFSFDILNTFIDEYFDLIYIDGDHSYEGVKKDLNIAINKVKKEGYIFGHDYNQTMFPGVVKAVNEFCNENNLEISYITNDGCPTFGIIKN